MSKDKPETGKKIRRKDKEMTIDEFMKNVAPYMKKCWISMDKDGTWCRFSKKPHINMTLSVWDSCDYDEISDFFVDIEPVQDWTKSLIRMGK